MASTLKEKINALFAGRNGLDMWNYIIVAVDVAEGLLDKEGRLCIERAHLAAFAHGEYFELGKSLGKFGFSVAKKKKKINNK